jgi:hypothetical protein
MGVRSRCTAAIGLALVILAVLVPSVYSYWLTRTFVAYEMPVSLAPGEIHSQEFSVNLAEWYQISVDVDQAFQFRPSMRNGFCADSRVSANTAQPTAGFLQQSWVYPLHFGSTSNASDCEENQVGC